ncbi:MAG: NAD-dependent epimerase/dehydratase family protein [Sarcina sp.]
MKMLIIGGTSFMGSSMTKQLIDCGYNIDVLANKKEDVFFSGYNEVLECDRSEDEALKNLLINRRYDYIVDIDTAMKKDVMNLLNVSSKKNIGKYILCSSNEVYNDFTAGVEGY